MRPSIFSVAVLGGVAAVDYDIDPIAGPNNEVVNISSCQSITCDKYTSGMCTRGSEPGAASTVGIVANAFEYNWGQGPYTDMSFTLVTGMTSPGFRNLGSDRYEWSDAHLFVGLNRSLDTEYYPRGCGLMLQYEEQTFPLEPFPGNVTRYPEYQNTTNCDGVITTHCQTSLAEMILKFKPEPLPEDGFEVPFDEGSNFLKRPDNCTQLADYMNTQLANSNEMCGRENGAWISSSIKVTGGPLPSAKSVNDMLHGALGSNKCYPVLPEDYRLFKVAETRHIYYHNPPTADAAFYGETNAGLSGWTPIVALWTDDGEGWSVRRATIQFMCMRTFKTDGGEPESPYEKSSDAGALSAINPVSYGFLVCLAGLWLLFNIASGGY